MIKQKNRKFQTRKKHRSVRKKIFGTTECPRLAVHKSGKHIYAQVIDDTKGVTLASSSTLVVEADKTSTVDAAKLVGADVAKKALEAKVKEVVFDRGGFVYHGRIASLAQAAREAGLDF